jgi:lipopolysaccharide export system permease protein
MIFKKIDRYVSTLFLARALGCALLVVLLYVSFDVLKRLDDIKQAEATVGAGILVAYYAQVVPLFLLELVPGVVLVAAGMALVGMARSGELMALKACGTSLHRVVAPIFFWTILLSVAVSATREWLAPRMMQKEQYLGHVLDGDLQHDLLLPDRGYGRWFRARCRPTSGNGRRAAFG